MKSKEKEVLSGKEKKHVKKMVERLLQRFFDKMQPINPTTDPFPMPFQIDILKATENYFNDKDRLKFFSDKRKMRRLDITRSLKMVSDYREQLEKTAKAAGDIVLMLSAEIDSRDIGKEPSDKQLLKDEEARTPRLSKMRRRRRFVQESEG